MACRNMLGLFKRVNLEKQILALLLINVLVSGLPQKTNANSNTGFHLGFIADPKDVAKCVQDPTGCTNIPYYPKKYIANLMNSKKTDLSWLSDDAEKTNLKRTKRDIDEMDGDNESDMAMFCKYEKRIAFPQIGLGKNGQFHFIIQFSEANITQKILVETCLSGSDGFCQRLGIESSLGITTQCEQRYSYTPLMVLSEISGEIVQKKIKVPSSCVCMYRGRNSD